MFNEKTKTTFEKVYGSTSITHAAYHGNSNDAGVGRSNVPRNPYRLGKPSQPIPGSCTVQHHPPAGGRSSAARATLSAGSAALRP